MRLTLFCRHSSHIADLQEQVRWMRDQLVYERSRADHLMSELLRRDASVAPLTPYTEPPKLETPEQVAARMMADREFSGAGDA